MGDGTDYGQVPEPAAKEVAFVTRYGSGPMRHAEMRIQSGVVGFADSFLHGNQGAMGLQLTFPHMLLAYGQTKEVHVRVHLNNDGGLEAEVIE